ncbi:hypothetical protein HYX14_03085 [Candidatus Woesearchaeota archaeon]|nr:hypothetical protein [Candidatus Woesearchaeota archaeon]
MDQLTLVLLLIIGLFLILLMLKNILKKEFCVLCAASLLTWLILLGFFYLKKWDNITLIAILLGSSILGIFYLVEANVPEHYRLFRLPFYLTLFLLAAALVRIISISALFTIIIIWVIFLILFLYRRNPNVNAFVQKAIACCKRW